MKALPAESADSARYLANRLNAGSRSQIAPLAIGTPASSRGSLDPPQGTPTSQEGQRLARLAGEFESMLVVQMLREMRKSGSWADENEEKSGFGAEALFESLDVELASYITKAQSLGLEKSLVKAIAGSEGATPANGVPPSTLPLTLPSMELPSVPVATHDPEGAGASPVADRVQTSPFGWRVDPFSGATSYHRGVDLRAAYGEPIGAADAGTVVFAGEQRGYGQTVVLEHAGGVRTRYAHLSSLMTERGAEVKAGDAIGRAGKSGRATGTHLHFEVTRNGQAIDPHTFRAGGLKPERVTADWEGGTGPTLPGVPSELRRSSGAE